MPDLLSPHFLPTLRWIIIGAVVGWFSVIFLFYFFQARAQEKARQRWRR